MIIGQNIPCRLRLPDATVTVEPLNLSNLKVDTYYPIGDYVYKYIGKVDRFRDINIGEFAYCNANREYMINSFSDDYEDSDIYHISNIRTDEELNQEDNLEFVLSEYQEDYIKGNNLLIDRKSKLNSDSDVFIPELKASDDALTRIMKKMIAHKQIIPSEYRATMDREYSFDNMRSALAGSTLNMTISKFMAWCDLLNLDWEFSVSDNGTDQINPLDPTDVIQISKYTDISYDVGESEKGIFKVPINDTDDPLKKLIKFVIAKKHININDYRDRGSTPYLLNNMRSALKSKSKMMTPYFINWCEILGLHFELRVIDPTDGVVFEADETYCASEYNINEE